ncbi:MAG: peptidoglycan DD-metalloendopeptidase family protein [Deltaproteobacteria bacterium]|nr:peptidoglycan DD-metalloendopeptidase family protein [Deltaproteobacteria bacterium]
MLDHELSIEMAKAGGIGLKQMLLRDFGAYADKQGAPEKPMHTVVPVINQKPVAPAEAVPIRLQESPNVNIQNDIRKKEFMPIKPEPQFLSPIEKSRISSGYGMRHDPQTSERRFHHGIDIASPEGTPVHPSMDGTVIFSGRKDGYGNTVEIRHDNGYITRYAHTKENLVDVGQRVTTNDMIAKVGNTGRSTGPHLHFEVRLEGYALNPLDMVSFS